MRCQKHLSSKLKHTVLEGSDGAPFPSNGEFVPKFWNSWRKTQLRKPPPLLADMYLKGGGGFLSSKKSAPENDPKWPIFDAFYVIFRIFSRLRRPSRVFSSFLALFLSFSSFLSASRLRREIFRDKKAPPPLLAEHVPKRGGLSYMGGLS